MNQGMIATGNHFDFDSLRGAPPSPTGGAFPIGDKARIRPEITDYYLTNSGTGGIMNLYGHRPKPIVYEKEGSYHVQNRS